MLCTLMTTVISHPCKYVKAEFVFPPPTEEETEGRPHPSLELPYEGKRRVRHGSPYSGDQ